MNATTACRYKITARDSYGTTWGTSCGHEMECAAPIEVGFAHDPLPTELYTYCPHCGLKIVLDRAQ